MPKHVNKLKTSKTSGVATIKDISQRDKLIIDNYLETFNKSRSVMEVMPDLKHQSQANHLFTAIWDKKEVQIYVKERRNYLTTQRPGLTVYEVSQELQNQMFGDITQILDCKSTEDLRDLPAETRRLIQNCKITKRTEKDRAGNVVIIEDFDYKFVDKQSAQKEYAKITGMHAIDNQQKSQSVDLNDVPLELQAKVLAIQVEINKYKKK